MTTSAPNSIGLIKYGVATVLSTIKGTPTSWAISATVLISKISFFGFAIVSPKKAFVFGLTASRQDCGSAGSLTKVTSIPNFGSV